ESKEFPKYRFAIMGFLDSLAGIIGIIGAVHTSGTTQVVLQQSGIVFTLIASLLMLNKR
ncbi:transmembrane protein, partial [Cystoisospora suis]